MRWLFGVIVPLLPKYCILSSSSSPKVNDVCKCGHDLFTSGNATQPAGTEVCPLVLLKNACLGLAVLLHHLHFSLNMQASFQKKNVERVLGHHSYWVEKQKGEGLQEGH